MNTNGNKTIKVGTKVTYRGSWGHGPVKEATIESIELCDCVNAKYGTPVSEVSVEDIRRCVFDLDDGHWAYGDQIVEILSKNIKTMEEHITNDKLQTLMEQFMSENPYADSFELAKFMYNKGWENGMSQTCEMF